MADTGRTLAMIATHCHPVAISSTCVKLCRVWQESDSNVMLPATCREAGKLWQCVGGHCLPILDLVQLQLWILHGHYRVSLKLRTDSFTNLNLDNILPDSACQCGHLGLQLLQSLNCTLFTTLIYTQ